MLIYRGILPHVRVNPYAMGSYTGDFADMRDGFFDLQDNLTELGITESLGIIFGIPMPVPVASIVYQEEDSIVKQVESFYSPDDNEEIYVERLCFRTSDGLYIPYKQRYRTETRVLQNVTIIPGLTMVHADILDRGNVPVDPFEPLEYISYEEVFLRIVSDVNDRYREVVAPLVDAYLHLNGTRDHVVPEIHDPSVISDNLTTLTVKLFDAGQLLFAGNRDAYINVAIPELMQAIDHPLAVKDRDTQRFIDCDDDARVPINARNKISPLISGPEAASYSLNQGPISSIKYDEADIEVSYNIYAFRRLLDVINYLPFTDFEICVYVTTQHCDSEITVIVDNISSAENRFDRSGVTDASADSFKPLADALRLDLEDYLKEHIPDMVGYITKTFDEKIHFEFHDVVCNQSVAKGYIDMAVVSMFGLGYSSV